MTLIQQALQCEEHNEHWWVIKKMLYRDFISATFLSYHQKRKRKLKSKLIWCLICEDGGTMETSTGTELALSCRRMISHGCVYSLDWNGAEMDKR